MAELPGMLSEVQLLRYLWFASCSVPHPGNCHNLFLRYYSIHDPVGPNDNLTDVLVRLLRNNPSELGKLLKVVYSGNQAEAESFRRNCIVSGYECHNFAQIISGLSDQIILKAMSQAGV